MKKNIVLILFVSIVFLLSIKAPILADQQMSIDLDNDVKYIGHEFDIYPQISLDNNEIDALSLRKLHFDTGKVSWVQSNTLNLFQSQVVLLNEHNESDGTIRIDMGKNVNTPNYTNSSSTHFAEIKFLAINTGVGVNGVCNSENGWTDCKTHFSIDYDGTSDKSGVFLGGNNLLDSVIEGDVILQEDSTPPRWSDCYPSYNASDIAVNSNVYCSVVDNETDIYLYGTSLRIWDLLGYNDTTFTKLGANLYSTLRITNGYRIIADPSYNFPYDSEIKVSAEAQDNAYNNGPVLDRNTGTFFSSGLPNPLVFRTESDVDAPSVYDLNPNKNANKVEVNAPIHFKIHDIHHSGGYPGVGVDINSLKVIISANDWGTKIYDYNSVELVATQLAVNTPYNNPYDFSVNVKPVDPFPQNTLVTVKVEVDDLSNSKNHLSTEWTFETADTIAPVCYMFNPEQGSTTLGKNQDIHFKCIDTGVGIDINSFLIKVNGISYSATGLNNFEYTGTPSSYDFTIKSPTRTNGWVENKAFEVVINGSDLAGNYIDEISYGLAKGIGECQCSENEPCSTYTYTEDTGNEVNNNTIVVGVNTEKSLSNVALVTDKSNSALGKIRILKINNNAKIESVYISSRQARISISGIAPPNTFIMLMIKSNPLFFTTRSNVSGKWTVDILNVFTPGFHEIFAVDIDPRTGNITKQQYLARFTIYDEMLLGLGVVSTSNIILWVFLFLLLLFLAFVFYQYKKNNKLRKKWKME